MECVFKETENLQEIKMVKYDLLRKSLLLLAILDCYSPTGKLVIVIVLTFSTLDFIRWFYLCKTYFDSRRQRKVVVSWKTDCSIRHLLVRLQLESG